MLFPLVLYCCLLCGCRLMFVDGLLLTCLSGLLFVFFLLCRCFQLSGVYGVWCYFVLDSLQLSSWFFSSTRPGLCRCFRWPVMADIAGQYYLFLSYTLYVMFWEPSFLLSLCTNRLPVVFSFCFESSFCGRLPIFWLSWSSFRVVLRTTILDVCPRSFPKGFASVFYNYCQWVLWLVILSGVVFDRDFCWCRKSSRPSSAYPTAD